jgi:predicted DNA-binding antitoxin AbrB/MazE fold protein
LYFDQLPAKASDMNAIRAIYENGVFRPLEPVDLPDHATVVFEPREIELEAPANLDAVYEVLSRRHRSGHADTAARDDEHQP